MTKEEARVHINGLISSELTAAPKQSGGYDTYICPFCENGSGDSGDGICTKDEKNYKCYVCGYSGDYLDILKRKRGMSESEIFDLYGLTIDAGETHPPAEATPEFTPKQDIVPVDYTHYCISANKLLHTFKDGLPYLKRRGLSEATADRFMLGYDMEWKHPTAGNNAPVDPRIIIPTGKDSYLARAMNTDTPAKYKILNVGTANIFNADALNGTAPVFVTEGAFDALSIIEVGGEAVALGGASNVNKLLELCKKSPPTVPLFLSLDNDDTGVKAQEKLKAGLDALNIPFYEVNVSGEHKDPNAHLVYDRQAFSEVVNSDLVEAARQEAEAERGKYLATSTAYQLDNFLAEIAAGADKQAISTGFQNLDNALDGGLYEGLYIVGAISSIGKTTFILQMADQIAHGGNDVLIFSLEMSRSELISKSLSRLTLEHCNGDIVSAKSNREIQSGWRHKDFSGNEKLLFDQCVTTYREDYSKHIYIHEGVGTIGVEQIKQEVQRHISYTGNTPVVVIDYLQIISPTPDMKRATDKQITDQNVLELKRLSRDKKLPILAISSFNRDNYTAPVNMASFKESGAIEYSSDVLLGLQLAGMDELKQGEGSKSANMKQIDEWKSATPRKAELKILKNRSGKIGVALTYSYYPKYNLFTDASNITDIKARAKKAGDEWMERKLNKK
ncbi:MAG: toprim domain-containing protein [Oscillospiraceae bacterium]|nr:toprim domain-containing protein [Oscillospiraceae bacterium]